MAGPVLIAGGGIAGLGLALTLHQIGVPARVYESARQMRPLGVGVNLQPNAVRELFDMGLGPDVLDRVGVPAREWALVGLNGREVYAEPRGDMQATIGPNTPFIAGRFTWRSIRPWSTAWDRKLWCWAPRSRALRKMRMA